MPSPWHTHGTGAFTLGDLGGVGARCVIEEGVLVFNAPHVYLGDDVYVGHRALLHGDTRGELRIGRGSWIGPDCYLHSAGGIAIGQNVGLAPRAMVLTSKHAPVRSGVAIFAGDLELAPVTIGDGSDIGLGAIILPGVTLGTGVLVGAGAVVTESFGDDVIVAGVPARVLRGRTE
jgi:acetyltransferase-like isoleucine patch superfamily enzyme